MRKLTHFLFIKLTLCLVFFNLVIQQNTYAQCPVIQFEDLRGVIGFPQFDNTSQCGEPDTLSLLIFTDAPGEILGFDLTVNLVDGVQYGGFENTQFGENTSIAYAGGSPTSPKFSLSGVTDPDNVMVANIGIGANCDLDLASLYTVSLEYEYIYQDELGNIIECDGTFMLGQELNSALKRPELNMNTVSPLTRTLATLGVAGCQTMVVSQDGLQASLGEMSFGVCNVPTTDPNFGIISIKANGVDAGITVEDDSTVVASIDGSYFLGNTSQNPTDEKFNTAEKITFEVCYQSDLCPTQSIFNPVYKAWYGCEGDTCNITSQTSTLIIKPNGASDPVATASFSGPVEICGEAATISLTVNNPGGSGLENTYTDLSVGYETCERTNLGIAEVRVGGVALSQDDYEWVGDDLTVHFDSLDMIPGSGLTDADGDGFFDDLEGGATVSLEIDMAIICGVTEVDPTSLDCPSINCPFATFFIEAKSNCGNAFNRFPPVDPFEINYGPTGVSNENEDNIGSTDNPILGYDFGTHGTSGSNATPLAPATIDYEFCYDFAATNVSPCPTGAEYGLKLTFAGDARLVQDYEVVPGTMTYSADGGADVSIPDANATFMTPDPADPGIRMLTINGGAANDMVCYKMQLQLDTAYCAPVSFVAVSQQVTEFCADCDCTIVKACKNTLFASDPSFYDCPCLIGHDIEVTRKNLGYTDHTMTTKVDRQTILDNCPADLTNFGPGDTMAISVAYDIKDLDAVTNMNMWLFSARVQSTTGTGKSVELPLTPDRRAGGITKWEVVKADGTASVFSFDDFEECNTGGVKTGFPALSDRGLQDFTTDFEAIHTNAGNSGNDDYDNTINSYFYVRNAAQSNECGSVSTSPGGNCLQAFFDAFDFQVGDTIKMHMEFPMKRNPYRAAAIAAGETPILTNGMVVRPQITMYNYDEFGNASYCYTTNSTSCNGFPVVNVAEYGGVSAITELDLDNCGGAAKHTFTVANLPPTGWYGCEFRPIVNLDDVDAPMFGPFAYCGNPLVTDYDGVQTMVAVDSTINSYCTTVGSIPGDICATEDASMGDGKVVFDLASQGIRALGVGLMNDDSLCLSYDLCALCPAPFTIDYKLIYDWSDICNSERDPLGYVCNTNGANQLGRSFCDELGVSGNYYTGLNLDTLQYQLDESSKDFIVNDNRIPDAGMSASNEGADLVAAAAPGTSIEYQEIELCNADGTATQMGVGGAVTLPNSVLLVGVFSDAAGTMPLTTALVSDNGVYKTYSIETIASMLAPGVCETVYVGTTLLFCPELPAPPPQICVSATSGCAAPDVTTALAGNGTCGASETCYAYIAGEADLQTEWYNTPNMADLCTTETFYVRVKNTKQLTLLDLATVINLPVGVNVVPGSWEAAYPGGTVGLTGNFGAWTPMTPQPLANGTSYAFEDDDYSAFITSTGLPGVFTTLDSNTVSFRFMATTECDNFISGTKFTTETTASDPCGPNMLMSGQVESPPLIINGADPEDNAQILNTAQPKEAFCTGGPTTFGLTALNISELPTSDEVETCITIPMEALIYVPGSVSFTSPSYTPALISEDVVGDNTVVCFDSPALMPGQKFSLQFMATQPEDALCGPIMVGMDVKSFEAAVVCESAPDMTCGVFVQNSINSAVIIEMGPPLETVDVRLNRQCDSSTDPEQFCYEIDMVNPGDVNYTGNIRVGIHDDVLADGLYDAIVDAELAGFDHIAVSVDAGEMITIDMCLDVPAAQACPIILRQTFETGCACDEFTTPFDNIPPAFLDTIECQVLCAGEAFITDICGGYEFTLEPAEGGTIVSDGSTLSVTLNTGFGVDAPVVLTATEAIGDCISEASLELKSTGDYAPVDLDFQVCVGECIDPDLMIPANVADGSTIEITKVGSATTGDDLDMSDPEVCGDVVGMDTYTVTITANPTCIYTFDFTVEVLPIGVLTLTDAAVCNHPLFGGTIEADPTFDNYQFFLVLPNGAEVLKYSGPLNAYNTTEEGDYVVKATRAADLCPSVTTASISSDHCVDLALIKEIEAIVPGPYPTTGGTVEYKLSVMNQGGVEMNQITLTDFVPEGLTNNDPNWTPIGMTNGNVTRVVSTPGFESGDVVEVSIVLTVNPGATYENTVNIAEISAMQDVDNNDVSGDDIDSTPDTDPNNDPGGMPDSGSDNTMDGDGTNGGGANRDEDPLTDEDDNDPATLPIFDLALTKTVDPASVPASGMFGIGDPIVFLVTVMNQGSVDATNVVITDLIPCGMEVFDDADAVNVAEGWGAAMVSTNASSGFETQTTIASLPAGMTVQIPIKMTLATPTGGAGHTPCMAGADPYINYGYIQSALDGMGMAVVDIDSEAGTFTAEEEGTMPNAGGDNDTNSTGNGASGSQDDSDPANIEIFDLALSKILNPDNGPYAYGETATFEICVTNQGNVPSDDVQIIDYIAAGYAFAPTNDPKWTDNGDGTATYDTDAADFAGTSTPGQIGFLEQVCVSIDLIVQAAPGDPVAYINTAEIAGANTVTDPDGPGPGLPVSTPVTADNDGPFDTDMTNDAGGEFGTPSDAMTSDPLDPAIQGNGTGAPGDEDPLTDSDDADIAAITIVDFALTKTIASPDAPYAYGDTITYEITVFNQGTVTGMNITVTDYAPAGLEYIADPIINPGWTGVSASHMYMINEMIEPGDSVIVPIKMIVTANGSTMADYTNIAEIFSVFDDAGVNITNDDVDSQPDGNPLNDGGGAVGTGSDDVVDGDGTGANGDEDPLTDEDDNDPAFVQIFDLAQTKEIVGGPYTIGDLVEYKITTINQGNTPVINIVVNDYVPAGLSFSTADNPDWMFVGANPTGNTVSTEIKDEILPGEMVMTSLFLTIQAANGDPDAYTNYTEISSFEDTNGNSSIDDPTIADADSTPDDDPVNDAGGNPDSDSDDSVDGDGTGDPLDEDATTDEDDQDPAMLSIPDLALTKTTAATGPFSYGDIVTFDITVINQGNVVASDVEVTDYIPGGFIYETSNDPLWDYNGTVATTVIEGPVNPGDEVIVSIDLMITQSTDPTDAYTNEAEISEAFEEDGTTPFDDVDSEANGDNTDDAGGSPMSDSDNSVDGTGTNGMGAPDDTDAATDEDDADPELIEVVDVAQTKMLVTAAPYEYGQEVEFTITTYNQGNVPLENVVITDYIPAGFSLSQTSEDAGWVPAAAGAEYTITDVILPGESVETTIFLVLGMTTGGEDDYTNVSEVSMMSDTTGVDVSMNDADSDINNDPADNGGGEPNSDSDDVVDGDGTGAPGDEDAGTDEDNSDPAFVEIFDLAVIMENSDDLITMYGQDITFPITLANQGNVDSDMPEVTVTVPDGFVFDPVNNPGWVDNGDGTVTYTYPDVLAPGDLEMFDLVLTSQQGTDSDSWTPVVAITEDNPVSDTPGLMDIDSDIDGDPSNDAGGNPLPDTNDDPNGVVGSDDSLTGDGSGAADDTDAATDSDASDPELVRIVDVAQTKTLVTDGPYTYGQVLEFEITTYNQGNVPLTDVVVTDYIPAGFAYDASSDAEGWADQMDGTATTTIAGPIVIGTPEVTTIFLTLEMTTGGDDNYTNVSEVTMMSDDMGMDVTGDDVDSELNNDPSDNGGGEPGTDSDDSVDGDGTGAPGDEDATTDQDNSDPALVEIFDLAIIMENSTDQITMYDQDVTFPITLVNQGNVDSEMPVITVMVPDGFMFDPANNPGWVDNGDGTVSYTYPDTLEPGDLEMFDLVLTSQPGTTSDSWTPIAEISEDNAANGADDIDSNPDTNFTDDAGGNELPDTNDDPNGVIGSDDSLDGDGTGAVDATDAATDEDDNDPEFVRIVDVAQTKTLITEGPYTYGQVLEFEVTTYNQGNIPLTDVVVTDYIPAGFAYDASSDAEGWADQMDGTATTTIAGPIVIGTPEVTTIFLTLEMTTGGDDNYTNVSEVTSMTDGVTGDDITGDDVDSELNNDPSDNGGGAPGTDSDDSVDGDGTGAPGDEDADTDEDNSDPALVEIFDLAVVMGASTDTLTMYGQDVTFPITLTNQGNVDSDMPVITVMVPDGFMFDLANNPGWVDNGDGTVSYTYPDTLEPGDLEMIDLVLTSQQAEGADAWTPVVEITEDNPAVDGLEDIDSNPDAMFDNDAGGASDPDSEDGNFPGSDDILTGDGTGTAGDTDASGDEDDNDPELVNIFDLALTKVTMMTTGNSFGDQIEFMITVYNQGNIPATNVEVTDFMPSGFGYVAANDAAGWEFDAGLMTATTTITDVIEPGESVTLSYFVTIMMSNMGDAFQNQAEISRAEDEDGNNTEDGTLTDADSTPDAINGNDAGGEPGTDSDNAVDGDASGTPGDGNADTDEDDSDPALIQVIDVAIQKTIVDGQAPFAYGTPVDFLVKVINQGNEPLVNVQVTDYIPAGYTYDTASDANGWSYDGTNATNVIEGPMEQWDEEDLIITLIPTQVIPSDDETAWTNVAEVSQMFNEDGMDISLLDIDSQSDNMPDNDPGGEPGTDSDDSLDGDGNNGGGAPGDEDATTDEDDADPALLPVFDLALTKQLVNPDIVYVFGDEMEFVIEVTNQGNQAVTDVTITDYIPGSLTEVGVAGDNTGWIFNGATADYTITDVVEAGESIEVTLFMIFQEATGGIEEYINVAEISEFADTEGNNSTDNPDIVADADSTPDAIEGNDPGGDPDFPGSPSGSDNTIDNEVVDGVADEDDSDPVLLGFVDMALVKTLVDPTTPIQVGADVTFAIEVTNQGTIPMIDVEVIDYIPAGFVLSANDTNDWEPTADGNATNTVDGPLGFSESETLEIVLTVLPDAQAEDMINVAELTEFFFESGDEATDLDIDSDADAMPDNDAGGDVYGDSDDAVDGDGTGAPGDNDPLTDEDDADPAVPNVLDLALAKTIDPMTPAVRPGDLITFMIEVCNQGNIPVEGVTVHDDVPVGLLKVPVASDGWNLVSGNTWAFVIEERLLPETCTTIEIELEVLANSSAADMINVAEITEVIDTNGVDVSAFDIDSTPNDDNGEAAGTFGTDDDDSLDGSVPAGEDSDDADPAAPPVMDLAIQKINPVVGPSNRGDVIPFEITVYNQGNLGADVISIWDYVPAGLEFIPGLNPDWTEEVADESYSLQYNDGLAPGEEVTFIINLEVRQTATPMNVVNMTEIVSVLDENGVDYDASSGTFDYDSDFDFDNTNDVGNDLYDFENDNVLDEYGIGHGADGVDDEDDHDQAWVLLCDGISCEGTLNISLDENCMTTLTPSMFLTGDIFPDHVYELEIVGEDGEIHPNMFDGSDVGSSFTVSVINPLCLGNSCWMTVYLEDKLAPEIVCQDVTISCNGVGNIPEPTVVDQCGNVEIILIDEIKTPLDCDDNFVSMMERTYIGRDSAGNESEPCTQTIMLERVTVGIITPPESFLLPNNNLTCGSGFATDENGNPHVSVTGVPTTGGENYLVTTAEFDYLDISATGSRVLSGDDTGVEVVLGSAFDVYGMNFTSVGVSTNGYITTDIADSGIDWTNDCPLPTNPGSPAETTGARIYPLHDDLDADLTEDPNSGVFYEYFAVSPVEPPSGAMTGVSVFQWKVDHFNASGVAELDFQALLFDNGEIVYQYNVIGTEMGAGASVGIQSMAQEDNTMPQYGTEISCDEAGSVIAGTAVGLAPPGPVVDLFPFDNSIFCSGFSEYEDQVLFDDGCTKKIMRKFTIGEWHCNTTNEVFIFQMIDVIDDQAPSVTAPADMTVSTATFSCSASVELPAATVSDVCNDVTVDVAYPEGFIDNQNGGLAILPVGEHIVTYTAYDACGNSSNDVMTVTIVDQSDPIALCDGFDIVSIGTGNSASLTAIALDDGSFDECGDVTLSVARMDDPGFDDGSAFAPAVEFDCSDIGEDIMVALLVTDMGGNTNMCMVQVEVQDKIDAFISCPIDVTVDCTTPYDLDNLDSFGVPTITDNCTTTDYEETVVADFNDCGVGTITRTFTVLDNGARTCTQVITFENQSAPFGEADIEWPEDYIAPNGCIEADLSPAGLDAIDPDFGFPVVEDMSTCILTGDSFTDEEFIGGGGACRTIYRTWKVIDWCSPNTDGSFPTFEHTQLIEVNNVTAPVFISSTELITVESYAADCEAPVPVEGLTAEAQDDCTPDASLNYTYIVDLDNDDTNDIAGIGTDASGTYPLGTHSVRFTVTDGCGNVAFLERLFTIVNLKTATAYCLDNISVNLTPWDSDGDGTPDMEMATITPDLIDGGSFHSCGYDIQLSFSADVNDTELLVSCDDIGEVDIELWVTDENGNADFCTTTIEVQDNNDVDICDPDSEMVTVEGLIYTEDSEEVESVQVGLMGVDAIYDMTEETGEYAFADMPVGGDYMVLPYKNDDHNNGVSTLDLVLVQRHILGLGDLDSPYKMIAADVNYSQNISASDVVILRKVILGVYEEFPSNNSWRFVDAEYNFLDAADPWLEAVPEDYEIAALNADMNIDFIGVKTGDVNGSVTANAQSNTTEVRSDNTWSLSIDDKQVRVGELVTIEVKSTDAAKVYGWQYSLEANDLSLVNITPVKANVSSQNINDDRGTIHMSYGEANGLDVVADEVLYTITLQAAKAGKLSEMITIDDRGLRAESYHTDMDINSIEIRWNETVEEPVVTEEFSVAQNEPNPWYDRTTVSYFIPESGDVRFIVKDVAGRTLYSTSSYREAGKHTQAIESRFLESNGVLLYEVHYDDQVISNRMIHIK